MFIYYRHIEIENIQFSFICTHTQFTSVIMVINREQQKTPMIKNILQQNPIVQRYNWSTPNRKMGELRLKLLDLDKGKIS